LLVGLMLLSVIATGCISKVEAEPETLSIEDKLVGEWGNDDISFIFNEEIAMMVVDNFAVGDEDKGKVTWEIDSKNDPIHLDLIMTNYEENEETVWPMIIRFLTDDKIQMCSYREQLILFIEGGIEKLERPANFIDDGDKILFVLDRK
ncbi:MAG: hypothetical protein GX299_01040, partial [Epulopiscium sp.]|nr:hypothetical protein [Candidatus Epulonipiscium sp.]